MFTSKKNLQLIDYKNSYYCQQQRKKRRYKWLKISLFLLLIISLALVFMPFAQSNQFDSKEQIKRDNALIHGPQLLFENPDKSPNKSQGQSPNSAMRATFPVDIEANIEINGLVAYAEIKQTFINPYNIALAGKYQFPLPENSAVKQLKIKIGDVEILGEIMEKKAAKAIYQKAKKQGRKASLVEQQRPNLFTNKIANIPAQSTVVVTLKFIMPVSFSQGKFNLRLPLALTDRYQPKSASYSSEQSSGHSTKELPEPFKTSTTRSPTTHVRSVARSQSSINIVLNSGIPITSIVSDSHKIHSRELNSEQNAYFITLNKTQVISNKTFDLTWQLIASNQPQISSFTQEVSGEHYTLLTFFPPEQSVAQVIARDIIFIIDTSGSMQAGSMEQAKASLQLALLQLNNKDSFNIIAFDHETELLFPVTHMASTNNISKAQQFIDNLSANGGTEMYRPLSNALMMKKDKAQSAKAIRQIVFITDGAVANEFELMQLLNNAQENFRLNFRLYTVGIGAAPNGYFMKKAAQFGRGSYVFIQNNREVQRKMSHLMTKISQPALTNIALTLDNQVHQQVEVYPKKIPDLYFGEPLQIALKSQFPITSIQLTAETVSTPFYQQLVIDDRKPSKGISSLWARRKIESLLDSLIVGANKDKVKSQVIATSLNHQIISPYTSFIAVEKQPEVSSLLAKNDLSSVKKSRNNAIKAHESLLVAMPKTSLDWQLQFLIGIALMLLSFVLMKIRNLAWFTSARLTNKAFKLVSRNEKPH
ncbi:marine proteobacterial sortase target protein [Colwellia demingiae]|uniref:Marine proteobacterial sortase target protein n=1 Tax=Colwellia demingiae TaxID=89401 RepID=A0A5C6QH40_9GAMM|nr:marine proteobacterial sortase target protein [Colwellia demingiae]TWX67912.1 marine proteobacterial sortase target protein [Colwellia demingiae]